MVGEREVETKYDVDAVAVLPDLGDLDAITHVSEPVVHHLDAMYFDTADLRLAHAGITLRRREGGDDAGWHLKLPVEGDRQEIRAPLGTADGTPPTALRRIVAGVVRNEPLVPVAELRTERREVSLSGGDASVLALLCDDHVRAQRLPPGGDDEQTWREWELELHDGDRRLADEVEERLTAAGARPAAHGSKLARALGTTWSPSERTGIVADKHTTERELLRQHLAGFVADLARYDPLVRGDLPDAVHQMRVTCRRVRGILSAFRKSFDRDAIDPVREDLRWLIRELGRPRDLEVLHGRLDELLDAEDPGLVRDSARRWTDTQLEAAHRTAHREAAHAMESARYAALVDTLAQWAGTPPWSDRKDRPARRKLGRAVAREWRKLEKAAAAADDAQGTDEHVSRLHDVRRAAKKTRYAAEALAPVVGKDAKRLASKVEAIQDTLGQHHDTAVAVDEVVELGDQARADGQDTFVYGVLRVRLEQVLAENESDYERAWRKARKPQLRKWLE